MGDHDHGSVLNNRLQSLHKLRLGLHIHRRGRLVHQQNPRTRHQRACERHQLALATRQSVTHLTDRQVVAHGVCGCNAVDTRELGHRQKGIPIDPRAPEHDVFMQSAVDQAQLLGHETHLRTKFRWVDLADIDAIHLYLPVGGLVQARNQTQHGGFAAANLADDRHPFAGCNLQADVLHR